MKISKSEKALQKLSKGKLKDKIWSLSFTIVLLSFYFVYFLLRINPKLIYQSQEPIFFFDKHFINNFFSYPGGINELISRFLSQFFYHSWMGALLLVLVLAFVVWNTKLIINSISINRPILYLHWVPSVFLLALHSDYGYPLLLTLGLLWSLVSVNIFIRLAPSNNISRLLFYIILFSILYYFTAGLAFIFSITIIIYDVLYRRRIALPLLYIIFSGLLPYIGALTLFIINIRDAYMAHLTSYDRYKSTWLSWALYAFFPLIILTTKFEQKLAGTSQKKSKNLWNKLLFSRSIPIKLIQGVIIILLVIAAAFYSYDKKNKTFLLIDHYARFGEWHKILDTAQKGIPINNIVQCQVNRALYNAGFLCDDMFRLAQIFGSDGLFMQANLRDPFALQHSDIFFDLGLMNESEHWAHEAIAAKGDTPWILQRLALVNLLKENRDVAEKYLAMLKKTVWHKSWAIEYEKFLNDSNDFWARPEFRYLKGNMPESDFLISPSEPELCLQELLKNTKNRMAFEYFMAYCLLEGKIGLFAKNLYRLENFNYRRIPRHFEEALLIYNQITKGKGIKLTGISQETIQKFNDFNSTLAKYGRNKTAARQELEKYRDTYWFYGQYYYKPGK
jgi:hypothetical protein